MTTTHSNEQDVRLAMLNSLLTCTHRNLALVHPLHAELVTADPRFYVRLAAWYADHGDVRDHHEMFVVTLVLSAFPGHRDVGLAMLRQLPPYQLGRVVDFIHGWKEVVAVEVVAPKKETVRMTADGGLGRNVPRSVRTEVTRYLREREADDRWFDSTALTARKALKRLYALLHVKPGPRAQAVLFDDRPPAGSKLAGLKALAGADSPDLAARLIAQHDVPFRVAVGVVKAMTPAVLSALVGRMTPQEVINNLDLLRRRGAFDEPGVKAQLDAKLDAAKTVGRVSAFKAEKARDAAGVSADVKAKLDAVADARVKARGRITRPTALLIDKSGSMSQAIEVGKRLGALLAAVCDRELYAYAFDTIAYPVEAAGPTLVEWEAALAGITAGGGTSVGAAVEVLRRKRQYVEQLVVVTDEGENTAPLFMPELQKYRDELKVEPAVCFVKVTGATAELEAACRTAGVPADAYPFDGDYYALPNLVPLLARPSKRELLQEIVEYPLPARQAG